MDMHMKHVVGLLIATALLGCVEPDPDLSETESAGTIPTCPSGTWCAETVPAGTPLLYTAWAGSANDVFVVGDDGTILRRLNGQDWIAMTSGSTASLRGIWGTSSSDVWAVGSGGTVLRFNGTTWSSVTTIGTTANLSAIWQSSPSDIWVAGGAEVWHSINGGSSWSNYGFSGDILAISGTSASHVWITGAGTKARKWNGTKWTLVDPGSGNSYFSVLALASNNVWVSPLFPTARRFVTSWSSVTAPPGTYLNDIHAQATNDLWGVGGTKVSRWASGSTWTVTTPFGSGVSLYGVTGVPSHVWVVGNSTTDLGVIKHYAY